MENPEEIDPDWARYAETILNFSGACPLEVDLRKNLTTRCRAEFRNRGFPGTFAVLTAHDPRGRDLSAEENKIRQASLESELDLHGIRFICVDACSTDREHCECSVAIDVEQQRALAIALQYEQVAIFWYDGDAFWLVGAMVESDPIRLPFFYPR